MRLFKMKIESIFDYSKYYYYMGRFTGFAPYRIAGDITDGVIETKFLDVIPVITTLCIQFYLLYVNFNYNLNVSSRNTSFIVNIGNRLVLIIGLINLIFSTICNFLYRKRIWKIMYKIHKCDVKVRAYRCPIKAHKHIHMKFSDCSNDSHNPNAS